MSYEPLLSYWFADADLEPLTLTALQGRFALWFGESPSTDLHIRAAFAAELEAATELPWQGEVRGRLALIVVFDQLSRNAYRGTARAYALDPAALLLSEAMLARGDDVGFNPAHRMAMYLPLMHAEDLPTQQRSLALHARLRDESPAELLPALSRVYEAAQRHFRIIERFGRYPHRNAALNRASTPAEAEFLDSEDSSYQPPKEPRR